MMVDTMDGNDTSQTASSSYPFYVEMDSSEGLMLGQHVYIEMDYGQTDARDGLWLDEYYIVDPEGAPYVWAADEDDRLEKRSVTLGGYDEELGKYEIKKGLSKKDCIAFPTDDLKEGMLTAINDEAQIPTDSGQGQQEGSRSEPEILEEDVQSSPQEDVIEENVIEEDVGMDEVIEESAGNEVIEEDAGVDADINDDYDSGDSGEELQEGQILEEVDGPPTEGE